MGLLKAIVMKNHPVWRIESAGTWALENEHAAANTIQVLLGRGVDISRHTARSVDRELVDSFQLILTMERGQKEAMRIEFPHAAARIFLLSEMVGQLYDIHDPMGGPYKAFDDTAREIDYILNKGFDKITQLSSSDSEWAG